MIGLTVASTSFKLLSSVHERVLGEGLGDELGVAVHVGMPLDEKLAMNPIRRTLLSEVSCTVALEPGSHEHRRNAGYEGQRADTY